MDVINIIADGSYKKGVIGIGHLRFKPECGVSDVKSVRLQSRSIITKFGGDLADMTACLVAINSCSKNNHIQLFSDNIFVVRCFNDVSLNEKKFHEIEDLFFSALEKYKSIKVIHRDNQIIVPKHAFAVAHNASAAASGAIKRETTLPYTGDFWAPESIASKHLETCEVRERLRRYGCI